MKVGPYRFRPGLWPTLATLPLLGLLIGLGLWQLNRAEQKQALMNDFQTRGRDAPITLTGDIEVGDGLRYRRAEASGRYDAGHQYLLDNKVHQGRVGYEVLTPLRLRNSDAAVLVDRGWVPQGRTRADLPAIGIEPAAMEGRAVGLVYLPSDKVFVLGEGEARDPGWPKVLQRIRFDLQSGQLGYRLLPLVLLLDPGEPAGYVRDWHPVVFGPERHLGYAVQWFAMAATLFVIYLGFQFQNPDGTRAMKKVWGRREY